MSGPGSLDEASRVKPIMIPSTLTHPGLAILWQDMTKRAISPKRGDRNDTLYVLRWNFFSYIVDPKLDPRFLEGISDENLYMVIQLYTIQHEHKEPLMTKREIMAFIIMH